MRLLILRSRRRASLVLTYADIRINRYRTESISTREKQVQNVSRTQNFGFGVRVLFKGTWGFASSRNVTPEEVGRITRQAVEIARANSVYQRKRVAMAPSPRVVTSWKSAFEKDPFDVAIDDKIQFLLKLNERAMKTSGVNFVNSSMGFVNEQKFYASTDGSRIEQYIIRANPNFNVTAVDPSTGDFQSRNSLGGPQGMGYE
jgi:TldD protein